MADYLNSTDLRRFLYGYDENEQSRIVQNILSTQTNGIEGLPYQFMESVDRRLTNTKVGRKYAEKIFSRLPLLFLTPCEPLFMDDFKNKSNKEVISQALIGDVGGNISSLLSNEQGRYYSIDFNYAEYYRYLNTMLKCVAAYMGVYNTKININNKDNAQTIGSINWQDELNSDFKTFFSAKENLVFYLDSFDSVSESFSNDTAESSLASQINGYSDQMNEVKFLFGKEGNAVASLIQQAGESTDKITESLSGALGNLGGGIVESLSKKGVNAILDGGKIIFPEIWSNSDFSRSYSLDIKLRSPDHDNLSIFLNILKPYCKLLCLTLPRQMEKDPNAYYSPFLVRAFSQGKFNIEMGMITSLTVNKGGTGCWNDDGLPTQLDITLEIKDLYSKMSMVESGIYNGNIWEVVNNTAYMDFLANMAGLNVGQMEIGRRVIMAYYLGASSISSVTGNLYTEFEQNVSKICGRTYNIL